jgi:hypothetical protein
METVMHIKTRGTSSMLYRSTWIKKSSEGNTHGFSRQLYVGSLPTDTVLVPDDLKAKLSSDELAVLEAVVVGPARAAADVAKKRAEHRARDPVWRLDDALRLIREAAALSADALVPQGRITSVAEALAAVKSVGSVQSRQHPPKVDPLGAALDAIRAAAQAIHAGHYGSAPVEGARRSKVYGDWIEITREVEGTGGAGGLLRALQGRGWVKAKSR